MTIKTTGKNLALLISSSLFMFGCSSHHPTFQKLLDKEVALASGIDFKTEKVVAVDPETEEEIMPCNHSGADKPDGRASVAPSTNSNTADGKTDCKVELLLDNNPALKAAIALSQKTIEGKIKKDGEQKPARFVVTVTTLYHGSHCNVVYSGGDQYENCSKHTRPTR
ncbi:hypothetical protein PL263_07750 [Methylomonas sp. EFPC3]|uniref:hypothetical protein n=1 Tax=Methylomonas sp. EFPC3 TaxID=3021710 RepID=UPI002416FA36|nr:hypothetical protein [Methylomonas sp. EFPC3]WFP51915.1 hypothetical protein PL263_07750 [Methylomonas sp. EFPC3]